MKVVGEAEVRLPVEVVWDMLHSGTVLARAIPGCERFDISGPGLGQFVAATTMPAIGGTYAGNLTVTDQQRPGLVKLTASAAGERGTITADLILRLAGAGDGTTLVSYEASAIVAGPLSGIGARLLGSAGKRLAGQFFSAMQKESLTASPAAPPAATVQFAPNAAVRIDGDRPPPATVPDTRVGLVTGLAIGLAGVIIGVLIGRRNRSAHRGRP
jgi:carbon monoxide dehydrogenase subunit G